MLQKCVRHALEVLGQDSVLLCESVDAIVRLSHAANGAADGVGLEAPGHSAGRLIDVGDVDLDRSVILGSDDAVARGAESGKRILLKRLQNIGLLRKSNVEIIRITNFSNSRTKTVDVQRGK